MALCLAAWGALGVAGCSAAPQAPSSDDSSIIQPQQDEASASRAQTGTINGTLLYSSELGPEHQIEFYDFGDGQTAVHATMIKGTGAGFLEDVAALASHGTA